MSTMSEQIQSVAKRYLEEGVVSLVIGYEADPRGGARPTFVRSPEDVGRLIWSEACNLNLVTYLHRFKTSPRRGVPIPKVAVVARPCDARAVNLLIHEEQIKRENIKVIGVTCSGSTVRGETRQACQTCQERVPVVYDALIKAVETAPAPAETDCYQDVIEMEGWSPAERLAYWTEAFDRCIRCYACRQACPGCYCFECVSEQVDPHWSSIALQLPEKHFFHVMRAFHLAGRCVACDACEAACPMDIPLSKLNRKLAREVEAMFGYRTGDDPTAAPPLTTFRPDEQLRM